MNETVAFNLSRFSGSSIDFAVNSTGQNKNFNSSGNSSDASPLAADTVVSVLTLITGFCGNALLLVLFAIKSSLRSPFNVYLINLLIANLATVVVQYPLDIASAFTYPEWPFGEFACTLYQYALWILEAGMLNSHQLIALNRLWAVVHPLSYRTRHSVRLAVIFCMIMWLLIHLAVLPTMVLDGMYYRLPVATNFCLFNIASQKVYYLALNLVLYAWPQIVIWLVFPVVMVAKVIRMRSHREVTATHSGHHTAEGINPRMPISIKVIITSASHDASEPREKKTSPIAHFRRTTLRSHNTLILALLTMAITVCWTPINVYFLWKTFDPVFAATRETFRVVAFVLFSVQTTVDPILFVLALQPLRNAIREVFSFRTI